MGALLIWPSCLVVIIAIIIIIVVVQTRSQPLCNPQLSTTVHWFLGERGLKLGPSVFTQSEVGCIYRLLVPDGTTYAGTWNLVVSTSGSGWIYFLLVSG